MRVPVVVSALLLAVGVTAIHGQQNATPGGLDYRVKAAFLYNFAKFVHWPAGKLGDDASPIVVAVLGKDPFGDLLDDAFRGKTVNGRRLAIRRVSAPSDLKACHIVFVSSSESERVDMILRLIADDAVLTVGETDRFAQRGGIIGFTVEKGRPRLEINRDAAQRAGIVIDSQFLRLAWVIEGGELTGKTHHDRPSHE